MVSKALLIRSKDLRAEIVAVELGPLVINSSGDRLDYVGVANEAS